VGDDPLGHLGISIRAMIRTDPPPAALVSMSIPETGFERQVCGQL